MLRYIVVSVLNSQATFSLPWRCSVLAVCDALGSSPLQNQDLKNSEPKVTILLEQLQQPEPKQAEKNDGPAEERIAERCVDSGQGARRMEHEVSVYGTLYCDSTRKKKQALGIINVLGCCCHGQC